MGCDIHCYAERKVSEGWERVGELLAFEVQNYAVFAFLADVRNDTGIPPLAQPRGLPDDISDGVIIEAWHSRDGVHSYSWLDMQELLEFDYERVVTGEERLALREPSFGVFRYVNAPNDPGTTTIRELLGKDFFDELETLKGHGAERIVFWFDN
jgi:hypothetical protein